MRLALLCDDPAVLPWLDALSRESEHEVTWAATLTAGAAEILRGQSGIRLTQHWEDLLTGTQFDAILVGGSDPQLLDAIKQLASAGQVLLFLPNSRQGSTYIYELSLIRDDNRVPLYPACWHRCDPLLTRVKQSMRKQQVQLVQLQREIPGQGSLPLPVIDDALLVDVDLLRWLTGDYNQVTALRTGANESGALTQSVKLAGRELPEATWDIRSGKSASCRLTIQSTQGQTLLEFDAVSREWILIGSDGTRESGNHREAVRLYLDQVSPGSPPPMEWPELVKAFETVDATHRSVARRRTIELHFEPMSERAMFKTQMTAIGCSVLVGTFLLVLMYLAVASTVPLPPQVLLVLRTLIFAPLGIFLLLQMLYPLTRPSESEAERTG